VVISGGNCAASSQTSQADITVTRNYMYKPASWCPQCGSWDGITRSIKNIFELKNAARTLIQGNVFEGNWTGAQAGFGVLFTPRGQGGNSTGPTTSPCTFAQQVVDTTMQYNILDRSESGINELGCDNETIPACFSALTRLLIQQNLLYNIQNLGAGGAGDAFQFLTANDGAGHSYPANSTFWHNTAIQGRNMLNLDGPGVPNFVFGNNLQADPSTGYGITASGLSSGNASMQAVTPGTLYQKNIGYGPFSNNVPSQYNNYCAPSGTCSSANTQTQMIFPADINGVQFTNPAVNNYQLLNTSPYHNNGTDGTDIGANITAINNATAGVAVQP
jgi:hypothetical protein